MAQTHTPGPWKVYEQGHPGGEGIIAHQLAIQSVNERGWIDTLADIRKNSTDTLPYEANARLIAASPRMAEILADVVTDLSIQATQSGNDRRRARVDEIIALLDEIGITRA